MGRRSSINTRRKIEKKEKGEKERVFFNLPPHGKRGKGEPNEASIEGEGPRPLFLPVTERKEDRGFLVELGFKRAGEREGSRLFALKKFPSGGRTKEEQCRGCFF